jgi:3-hydroxyisobutyrate dehydrogenase-like beta-hydroxyacid dehydrogenase
MKVGVVGVGIMGSAIAGNLLKRGAAVVGYDIDPRRIGDLAAAGGEDTAAVCAVLDRMAGLTR